MLRLTEIFYSLQGETSLMGLPTVFIRLTGCPLRCRYCDTEYAFQGGKRWEVEVILAEISQYRTPYVTVTGGEPLAQKACLDLLKHLCDAAYQVSLETSGALSIEKVDPRVKKIVDIKTPDSNECEKNDFSNLAFLNEKDELKFVICSRRDYDWSVACIKQHALEKRCQILFSPSYADLSATELADWILADQLPVRFQIQLHKLLWSDARGK